jgi:hypothetical protein
MINCLKAKNETGCVVSFVFIIMVLIIGCASGAIGKYKLSDEVRKTFISSSVLPDHNYYYSGASDRPDGILAVHKSYTLTSADLWIEARPDRKQNGKKRLSGVYRPEKQQQYEII